MNTNTVASTTRTKTIGHRRTFTAEAKFYSLGEQAPYFSVTAEERNLNRRGDNQIEACGAMHDKIVHHFPDLAPVVAVHLAGRDGAPRHALENARYWFGLSVSSRSADGVVKLMSPRDEHGRYEVETDAEGIEWAPAMAAKHLRVSIDEVREIRAHVMADGNDSEALRFQIRALAERWQAEADAAMALLTD